MSTPISNSTESRLLDIEDRLLRIETLLSKSSFSNQGQILKLDQTTNSNQPQKLWISQLVQDGVSVVMYPFELILYYFISVLNALFGGFMNKNSPSKIGARSATSLQRYSDPSVNDELTPTSHDFPSDMNINFSSMSQSRRKASRIMHK